MAAFLLQISPNAALVLLTAGVLLIYVELNRPGIIIFGAVGLLCAMLSIAVLARFPWNTWAAALILIAATIFLRGIRRNLAPLVYAVAILCLTSGFLFLIPIAAPARVHVGAGLACGILLGFSTAILCRIARRARLNKGLD